jgi:autotransporter passenger strand-loop-strand repeat protein
MINGGQQDVTAGGMATGTIVGNGGVQNVEGGGTVTGTIIGNGGLQYVQGGGAESDATVLSGGTLELLGGAGTGGTITINSGGTEEIGLRYGLSGFAVSGGVTLVVAEGGTASDTTILSGGLMVLAVGAVVSGGVAFVGSGMSEIVGSVMPSATISGFAIGDIIDLASIASGSGGSAVLTSGNVLDVTEGGSTYVFNLDPSKNYSGTRFVLSSDGISGTDITLTNLVSVTSGQTLTISSGQTSGGVVVLSGGTLDILSGGTAVGTTVNSGGSEIVSSGGTASNTKVSSGGSLVVLSHGIADPATIYSGGSETISAGGTDLGALLSGGIQIDLGLVSGVTVYAGSQVVGSAGTAIGTTVSIGGTEIVSSGGMTSGTLLSGGQEILSRGGRSSGTDILSGGSEIVSSGGSALATVISGGTLEVASGGTASGVIFSSGGILQLDSSSHLSGTISGFHLGEEIDLRALAFSSSSSTLTWKQTTSGANARGTLTVKEGTSSTTLTLVGSYTVSNFSATSDGHGGTLITDPPITGGRLSAATNAGTGSGSEGIAGAPGSGTTVHSGGYEFGGGTQPAEANGVFFSGGSMVQLDSLLSQFADVISGFDLGDEFGPHGLGFGSSSSTMSWGANAGAPGVDKGGKTFNLTLLGQYAAANFNAGTDSHGGSLITDPPGSTSVAQTPLVVHH